MGEYLLWIHDFISYWVMTLFPVDHGGVFETLQWIWVGEMYILGWVIILSLSEIALTCTLRVLHPVMQFLFHNEEQIGYDISKEKV